MLALTAACGSLPTHDPANPRPDSRTVHWQRSLADAEAMAKQHGRPLLVVLGMDGESASDRVWHENYRDPAFVASTRRCVCVVGSVFRHNAADHDAQGRRIDCPRFPGITCGEHIALEPQLFDKHLADGERVAPRHALVRSDGSKAFDLSLCFDITDVDRALADAVRGIEPWSPPGGDDWGALASRRDAAGRAAFEAAIAGIRDPREWEDAMVVLGAVGDDGALEALRRALARSPDVPMDRLLTAAAQRGLGDAFRMLLVERAQRVDGELGDLNAPTDWRTAVRATGIEATDLRARLWAIAQLASPPDADRSLVGELLRLGAAPKPAEALPRPGLAKRQPAEASTLHDRLRELDDQLANDRDNPDLLAAIALASFDLGRSQVEAATAGTQLLFEDAARYLERATTLRPTHFDWWLERAHVAYFLQRYEIERECGMRALALTGHAWPLEAGERSAALQDAKAVEALRWIGDAEARVLPSRKPDVIFLGNDHTPLTAVSAMSGGLVGLGLAAVSPFGNGKDWVGFASFAGSLGLVREEIAILMHAQQRLPAAADVRNALYAALWRADRWQAAPALADLALRPTPSADAQWWAGHARLLVAEELRRREQPRAALEHYAAAMPLFAAAERSNPAYADSVRAYKTLLQLGSGHACTQGPAADRERAATFLVAAAKAPLDFTQLRDGIGYDALDLVDKVLEWRHSGESPVDGLALLQQLTAAAPKSPFWPAAVSDALLREALRADGRNPQRADAETVDAGGKPIRMLMGLPTELGDRYLAAALDAGAVAMRTEGSGDLEKQAYAQALTVQAERTLVRGKVDGVRAAIEQAAAILAVELGPAPTTAEPASAADCAALRTWLQPLRTKLGPARPRQRDGR